jgi:hypothetical protein
MAATTCKFDTILSHHSRRLSSQEPLGAAVHGTATSTKIKCGLLAATCAQLPAARYAGFGRDDSSAPPVSKQPDQPATEVTYKRPYIEVSEFSTCARKFRSAWIAGSGPVVGQYVRGNATDVP